MDVSLLEEMDFDNVNIDWEFIETILKELPSNIYFKDTQCRYLFCTHYWNHIVHDDTEAWSIRGKTDMEIRKDKENARKALHARAVDPLLSKIAKLSAEERALLLAALQ